ncbi:MAG: hypothetical protein PHQ65_14300 [Bacteroidales bacterium]|nr:hypothetical protein [Bacteroidales bacterium]MDD3666433.1 hypothetical protein [Bacteroidales bacterium]
MIVKLFKTNYPVQVFLFLITTALLWFEGLLHPQPLDLQGLTPLQLALLKPFAAVPLVGVITAMLLTVVEALVFNRFLSAKEFVQRNTLLPAFLYLLFFSHGPHLLQVNSVTLAVPLVLMLLMLMLHIPDASELYVTLFFASGATTLASFVYPPAIFFLLFIWISFVVNRVFAWREWVISLIGGVLPIVFALSWLFLSDQLHLLSPLMVPRFANPLTLQTWPNVSELFVAGLIMLLYMAGYRFHMGSLFENVLSFRQKVWNLTWFALFGIGSGFFAGQQVFYHLALVTIPGVAFISGWLITRKRHMLINLFLVVLFLTVILQNLGVL